MRVFIFNVLKIKFVNTDTSVLSLSFLFIICVLLNCVGDCVFCVCEFHPFFLTEIFGLI